MPETQKSSESKSGESQIQTIDVLAQVGKQGEQKPSTASMRIEDIEGRIFFQSGTSTVAPTHKPRNFWESIVVKDDGANRRLWIYVNGTWRVSTLT